MRNHAFILLLDCSEFLLECAKKVNLEGAAEFLQDPNNGLKEVLFIWIYIGRFLHDTFGFNSLSSLHVNPCIAWNKAHHPQLTNRYGIWVSYAVLVSSPFNSWHPSIQTSNHWQLNLMIKFCCLLIVDD